MFTIHLPYQEKPTKINQNIKKEGITALRPSQEKAINQGLLQGKSLLICTPTASGKTLIAEIAFMNMFVQRKGKAVYIVPLKALANEKYKEFKERYGNKIRVALSIGDRDKVDGYLEDYDLIICTAEKLDSLIRHSCPWLKNVAVVVVDEIHLMNDPGRGPTLEILITIIKQLIPNIQLLCLSATIGNPEQLAEWLQAELVLDQWRPTVLRKGVYLDGKIDFEE